MTYYPTLPKTKKKRTKGKKRKITGPPK